MSEPQQTLTIQKALDLAVQHHKAGRLSQAESLYQQILQTDPNQHVALHLLGVIAHQAGKNDVAVKFITKAIDIKPDVAEAYSNLGRALRELGKLDDAVSNYRKALRLKPDYADAHNNLGNALKGLGRLEDAVAGYRKALAIRPDYAEAHTNLGSTLQEVGQLNEAVVHYHKAIDTKPDYAEAHYNLGNALRELGKLDEAVACYRKAVEIKPDYADGHINLGLAQRTRNELGLFRAKNLECLYALKRYEDFYLTLDEVIKVDKTNIRVAAISAFASQQLQRKDPYPFCRNPLNFIHVGHIKDIGSGADDLIDKLTAELGARKGALEPDGATTSIGLKAHEDLFLNPTDGLTRLSRILETEINRYHTQPRSESCLFIDLWPRKTRLRAWFARLSERKHQSGYPYLDRWLSGIVYLGSPKTPKLNDGAISFGSHGYNYPILNEQYPRTLHNPKMGDVILFPSSLFHEIVPVRSGNETSCIWFDLLPSINEFIQ